MKKISDKVNLEDLSVYYSVTGVSECIITEDHHASNKKIKMTLTELSLVIPGVMVGYFIFRMLKKK